MQVIIRPVVSLFDELSYRLLGWPHFDKYDKLDIELKTTKDLAWIFANWIWLFAFIYANTKGLL